MFERAGKRKIYIGSQENLTHFFSLVCYLLSVEFQEQVRLSIVPVPVSSKGRAEYLFLRSFLYLEPLGTSFIKKFFSASSQGFLGRS